MIETLSVEIEATKQSPINLRIATWRLSATRNDSIRWGERGSNPHGVATDRF